MAADIQSCLCGREQRLRCDERAISLLIVPLQHTLPQNCTHIVTIKVVRIINNQVISSFSAAKREKRALRTGYARRCRQRRAE